MTQEFVTLPRHVAEHAVASIEILNTGKWTQVTALAAALRAALEQPKNHIEQHLGMVPAGWKLVPVEPNCGMVLAGERSLEQHDFLRLDSAYRAMLAAAPKPPTTEQSSAVQPQVEREPLPEIVERVLRSAGKTRRETHNPCITANDCIKLANWIVANTHPQPKHEPLMNEQKDARRWRFLVENSFDKEGITQFHVWEHSWEPHSQTGEPVEWKKRVRGPALDRFTDRAIESSHNIK